MSEFDEEAERERLREKYERDKQKREASERMSELLLKGATMTNAHCETCGDPIFRYDGQEFCPTCQQPKGQAGGGPEEEPTAGTEADADTHADGEATDLDVESPGTADAQPSSDRAESPSGPSTETPPEPQPRADRSPEPAASHPDPREVAEGATPDAGDDTPEPGSTGGLADARAALERTLADAARRAEAAENARSRREHLGAAKEAAEALEALRNAR